MGMPATPPRGGVVFANLPAARSEIEVVGACLDAITLAGTRALKQSVLDVLGTISWAHFACHATSDPVDPARSHLVLYDDVLTAEELNRLRLDGAAVAYLSACSTAYGGTRLVDESIHVSSAFQLAGFGHVIGTLWPVADRVAVRMAEEVYAQLPEHADDPALVLHHATRSIRARYARRPDMWSPHIHIGP